MLLSVASLHYFFFFPLGTIVLFGKDCVGLINHEFENTVFNFFANQFPFIFRGTQWDSRLDLFTNPSQKHSLHLFYLFLAGIICN